MNTTILATKLRPFTLADAQGAVDLFNACSQALHGWKDSELDDLLNDWTSPGVDVEETIRVIEDDQGKIIGYVEVWDTTNPHVTKYVWGVLHPDHWDKQRYFDMLSWAETCARERIPLAPEGTRVIMVQGLSNKDIRRKQALESYGFDLIRHYYRMQMELQAPPMKPTIPAGITVGPIDLKADLKDAVLALEDGFKDHWGHVDRPIEEVMERWHHFLTHDKDFDPSLWYLAKAEGHITGICRCSPKTVEDPDMGWVDQLCVLRPWRRQGLGMALLLIAFNEFYRRGKQRVGLAVDASSLTNATHLYEKAGMHVSIQYDSYEFELRRGKDITTT
jgi:GNAT superfamily N-acetyltransferase